MKRMLLRCVAAGLGLCVLLTGCGRTWRPDEAELRREFGHLPPDVQRVLLEGTIVLRGRPGMPSVVTLLGAVDHRAVSVLADGVLDQPFNTLQDFAARDGRTPKEVVDSFLSGINFRWSDLSRLMGLANLDWDGCKMYAMEVRRTAGDHWRGYAFGLPRSDILILMLVFSSQVAQ